MYFAGRSPKWYNEQDWPSQHPEHHSEMEHTKPAWSRSHQAWPAAKRTFIFNLLNSMFFSNVVVTCLIILTTGVIVSQAIPLGLGTMHRQHSYFNHTGEALQGMSHRIGDSMHHLYYHSNSTVNLAYEKVHEKSVQLRGWLNSMHSLNSSSVAYTGLDSQKIKDYIAVKTGAALKGINELGRQGVNSVSGLRGAVVRPHSQDSNITAFRR